MSSTYRMHGPPASLAALCAWISVAIIFGVVPMVAIFGAVAG